jgi:hypothetical protein
MSHPTNKRERFLIGSHKGKKRAEGMCASWKFLMGDKDEWMHRNSRRLRDMTKACNCMMCANPRKVFGEETMQERRHEDDGRADCTY